MSTSINWPSTLPAIPDQSGYTETLPSVILATSMDVGPKKARLRSLVGVWPIDVKMFLTNTQKGYLNAFYQTTTVFGVLTFNFAHPTTGTPVEMCFKRGASIVYTPFGADWWAAFSLEYIS
jgi:hypothetical protein